MTTQKLFAIFVSLALVLITAFFEASNEDLGLERTQPAKDKTLSDYLDKQNNPNIIKEMTLVVSSTSATIPTSIPTSISTASTKIDNTKQQISLAAENLDGADSEHMPPKYRQQKLLYAVGEGKSTANVEPSPENADMLAQGELANEVNDPLGTSPCYPECGEFLDSFNDIYVGEDTVHLHAQGEFADQINQGALKAFARSEGSTAADHIALVEPSIASHPPTDTHAYTEPPID